MRSPDTQETGYTQDQPTIGQFTAGIETTLTAPTKAFKTDRKRLGLMGTAALFLATACGGTAVKPVPSPQLPTQNPGISDGVDYGEFYSEENALSGFLEEGRDIALGGDQGDAAVIRRQIGSPFSPREDIRINNGRHPNKGRTAWSAVDLALLEIVPCVDGIAQKEALKDWTVVATQSGEITVVGGERKTDPNHSVVVIKNSEGKIGYMHIDPLESLKKKVLEGDKSIEKGEPIGKVTCEYPPGGASTGMHLHLFTIDREGNAEPFSAGVEGWQFGVDPKSGETIATKGDETRYVCGGICNSGDKKNVLPIGDPNAPVIEKPLPEFAPETMEQKLLYDFTKKTINYILSPIPDRDMQWITWTDLSEGELEKMIRNIARGERIPEVIFYSMRSSHYGSWQVSRYVSVGTQETITANGAKTVMITRFINFQGTTGSLNGNAEAKVSIGGEMRYLDSEIIKTGNKVTVEEWLSKKYDFSKIREAIRDHNWYGNRTGDETYYYSEWANTVGEDITYSCNDYPCIIADFPPDEAAKTIIDFFGVPPAQQSYRHDFSTPIFETP